MQLFVVYTGIRKVGIAVSWFGNFDIMQALHMLRIGENHMVLSAVRKNQSLTVEWLLLQVRGWCCTSKPCAADLSRQPGGALQLGDSA